MAAEPGGRREWGRALVSMNVPDQYIASGGHASVAQHLFRDAGITPADVDLTEICHTFRPW